MTAFASFADFPGMGGHGAYVWSAYGLCLALWREELAPAYNKLLRKAAR